MSNQEASPGDWQPKLVEHEVHHNDNEHVERTVVTLGPWFGKVRRTLNPIDEAEYVDWLWRMLAVMNDADSATGSRPPLRLVSNEISAKDENAGAFSGC
jgi:hypothetical protein